MMRFEVECPRCGKKEQLNYTTVHSDIYSMLRKLGWQSFSKKKTMICQDCCLEYDQLKKTHNQEIKELEEELAKKLQIEKKRYDQKCEKLEEAYENRIDGLRKKKSELLAKFWP